VDITYLFYQHSIKTFIEYSDTFPRCYNTNVKGNCAYEHADYKGGYRYNGRSMASTYDNDAYIYTLGFIGFSPNGDQWKANLRYLDLNMDNSNRTAPGGNTAATIAEVAKQIDFTYIFPLFKGQTEAGVSYTHSNYQNNISSDDIVDIWAKWTYTF